MKKANIKFTRQQRWLMIIVAVIVVLIIGGSITIGQVVGAAGGHIDVINVPTLEKIIKVSELSTFTAIYNGIAQVMNEEITEETDFYVSYEAKVNAGIDFEKVSISIDANEKRITVTIPDIYITDVNVNVASLDYIFLNVDANESAVSQTALKACEMDVQRESEKQNAIFELAKQNAENVLMALIGPIIQQMDPEYEVIIR